VFINAFNLIDGIDGLAAGLSIFSAIVFRNLVLPERPCRISPLSPFSLVGALSGFFLLQCLWQKEQNIYGRYRIIDSRTVMSVLVIQFNEFNISSTILTISCSACSILLVFLSIR